MEKAHLIYGEVVDLVGKEIKKNIWSGLNVNRAVSYLLNDILNSKEINVLNLERGEATSKNQLILIFCFKFTSLLYRYFRFLFLNTFLLSIILCSE